MAQYQTSHHPHFKNLYTWGSTYYIKGEWLGHLWGYLGGDVRTSWIVGQLSDGLPVVPLQVVEGHGVHHISNTLTALPKWKWWGETTWGGVSNRGCGLGYLGDERLRDLGCKKGQILQAKLCLVTRSPAEKTTTPSRSGTIIVEPPNLIKDALGPAVPCM